MYELPGLRYWRDRRLLSMRELAEKAGVGYVTIFRLEHGKTATGRTVRKLAEALQVTPDDLLREPDQGQQEAA